MGLFYRIKDIGYRDVWFRAFGINIPYFYIVVTITSKKPIPPNKLEQLH